MEGSCPQLFIYQSIIINGNHIGLYVVSSYVLLPKRKPNLHYLSLSYKANTLLFHIGRNPGSCQRQRQMLISCRLQDKHWYLLQDPETDTCDWHQPNEAEPIFILLDRGECTDGYVCILTFVHTVCCMLQVYGKHLDRRSCLWLCSYWAQANKRPIIICNRPIIGGYYPFQPFIDSNETSGVIIRP